MSREVFWICYMYIVHVDNHHQIFLPFIGRQVWFAQFLAIILSYSKPLVTTLIFWSSNYFCGSVAASCQFEAKSCSWHFATASIFHFSCFSNFQKRVQLGSLARIPGNFGDILDWIVKEPETWKKFTILIAQFDHLKNVCKKSHWHCRWQTMIQDVLDH